MNSSSPRAFNSILLGKFQLAGVYIKKLFNRIVEVASNSSDRGKIGKISDEISIWYETFGRKQDPSCLLIMGAGMSGLFWSDQFCEKLAQKGLYVIRYDHRDTGFSTFVDFAKKPYTLLEMAQDALGLLNHLHIKKAHLVGLSMGGPIAELMSIQAPHKIQSLTLIATSSDFRPLNLSLAGIPPEKGALSSPQKSYQSIVQKLLQTSPEDQKKRLILQEEMFRILNGSVSSLDEQKDEKEKERLDVRLKKTSVNHALAIQASEDQIRDVAKRVVVPTLIIHGTEDPIFGIDHAQALSSTIKGAKIYLVERMGHTLNSSFSELIIDKITENVFRDNTNKF